MMTGFEFVILVFSIYVLTEIIRRIAAHRAIAKHRRSQGGADDDQHRGPSEAETSAAELEQLLECL